MQHREQRDIGRTESVSTSNLMTIKKKKNRSAQNCTPDHTHRLNLLALRIVSVLSAHRSKLATIRKLIVRTWPM